MEKHRIKISKIPVSINFSKFYGKDGFEEYNFSFIPEAYDTFENQLDWIYTAYKETIKELRLDENSCVFSRFFFSDLYNQINYFKKPPFKNCCISKVCQPPGPDAKISLWTYNVKDNKGKLKKILKENAVCLERENIFHYWIAGITSLEGKSVSGQTTGILTRLKNFLKENGMSLSDNMMRTWFFLKNIDTDYKEFVVSRRNFYAENGLTPETHFISSTGVGGSYSDINVKVFMDGYAIGGISKEQIKYLSAPEYLSSPYLYGVTFERGVSISCKDRKDIIISGTASINNKGEILYEGDVLKQLERTVKNIEALLDNSGCCVEDVSVVIVYLRDPTDYKIVKNRLKEIFKKTPLIITFSSVCRPGWLVEIECMAKISLVNRVG